MNRSRKYILAAALIAALVCAVCMPVVMATFAVQTSPSIKPSSCFISPKYPDPRMSVDFIGATEGYAQHVSWLNEGFFDGPPYTVQFHDLTPAPAEGQTIASRYWNFGDGSASTEKDPVHMYKFPGNYSVLLSVTTICGSQYTAKRAFYVKTYCTHPSPFFTSDVYEGMAPLTVHITDTSTRAPPEVTTWTYDYSMDGSSTARHEEFTVRHERNPVFTFDTPGTYTITLMVTKSCTEPAGPVTEKPSLFAVIIKVNPAVGYVHAMPFSTYSSVTTTPTVTAFGQRLTGNPTETTPAPGSASPGALSFSTPPATAATPSPQGAPAAPGTGTLSVVTDPAGAAIFLDDVTWGASPASIPNLAAGSHILRLEKAGYQNMSVPIVVTDGKTAEYSLNLIPENAGTNRAAPLGAAAVVIACAGAGLFLLMRKAQR